jgi:segregation and condensation protein B
MEELETPPQGVSPQPEETPEAPVETVDAPVAEAPAETAEPAPAAPEAADETAEAPAETAETAVAAPEVADETAEAPVAEAPAETAEAVPAALEAKGEIEEVPAETAEPVPATAVVSVDDLFASDEAAPAAVDLEDAQLRAVLEAIVYVAEEPLTLAQLAASLQQPQERIRNIFTQLVAEFDKPEHGVTIREVAGGYKMATKPEHHEAVRSFVKSLKPPLKLSLPALETLAVIAYKQPVTAPEIMEIRGVQGAGVLKTLLDRKLIAVAGRKNVIGKPILYKTTKEFLIQFGLKDLAELPSLKEFEEIRRLAFADNEPPAEPVTREAAAPEPAPQEAAPPEDAEPPTESAAEAVVEAAPAPPAGQADETAPAPEAQAEPAPRTEQES